MMSEPTILTEDLIYEAADLGNKVTSYDLIKYISFSLQQFTDLSELLKLTNLQILSFRLCGLTDIPKEILQIPSLKNLDLSGNALSALPDKEQFANLINLRLLNLSDNNISELSEIEKLQNLTNLQELLLTGNICLSVNNAFNHIISLFPQLLVLNESIITSQYRGSLQNIALFDNQSIIPLSKIDDYFFLYMKYLHASNAERCVRRANVEFFCISKILSRFSAIVKIQKIFRGYLKRKEYKKKMSVANYIQSYLKFWFYKRNKAADVIKVAFLHHQMKKKIKEIVSARLIQSIWRRHRTRQECLSSIFEKGGNYTFYISENNLESVRHLLKKNKIQGPDKEEKTGYRLIRLRKPKEQKLPGSPVVHYTLDESALIRLVHVKENTGNSVWCRHDHNNQVQEIKVSKEGVNYSSKCQFSTIKCKPYTNAITPRNTPKYPSLVAWTFHDKKQFTMVVSCILIQKKSRIRLFAETSIISSSSCLIAQSSCRTFLERVRTFRSLKKYVLEKRSARCIKMFLHSTSFKRSITHSLKVLHYLRSLPVSNFFYIAKSILERIILLSVPIKYKAKFGYSADRFALIEPDTKQLPMLFVPTGRLVFTSGDIASLFKLGVSTAKAIPSMISDEITTKWLRRNQIIRLTFSNPDEARIRISLYAYMTGDFKSIMSQTDVLPWCAANSIRNAWIGFITRKTIAHMGSQCGKKLNLVCLIRHNIAEKKGKKKRRIRKKRKITQTEEKEEYEYYYEYEEIPDDTNQSRRKAISDNNQYILNSAYFKQITDSEISNDDAISLLRGDYKPWRSSGNTYKKEHKEKEQIEVATKEADSLENDVLENTLKTSVKSENKLIKSNKSSVIHAGRIKKPLIATVRFPKKPLNFQIELETQTVFQAPLTKLPLNRKSLGQISNQRSLFTQTSYIKGNRNSSANQKAFLSKTYQLKSVSNDKVEVSSQNEERSSTSITSFKPCAAPSGLSKLPQTAPLDNLNDQEIVSTRSERKPLFDQSSLQSTKESLKSKYGDIQSAQKTDTLVRDMKRMAFSKLVRLRQVGVQIQQELITDSTIEENRQKADETRVKLFTFKTEVDNQIEQNLHDSRERNRILKSQLMETRANNEARANKLKTRNAKRIRDSHDRNVAKFQADKKFAQNFISMSRQMASQSEKVQRRNEEKKKFNSIFESSAAIKSSTDEAKKRVRQEIAEMKQSKLESAQWERMLWERQMEEKQNGINEKLNRVDQMKQHDKKLKNTIRELKNRSKRASAANETSLSDDVFNPYGYYRERKVEVSEDTFENGAEGIKSIIGSCGELESHLLAEIIGSIIGLDCPHQYSSPLS